MGVRGALSKLTSMPETADAIKRLTDQRPLSGDCLSGSVEAWEQVADRLAHHRERLCALEFIEVRDVGYRLVELASKCDAGRLWPSQWETLAHTEGAAMPSPLLVLLEDQCTSPAGANPG